jgi:hypothetical protein
MLRMPTNVVTDEAKRNLQRFFETSAARDIEQDARTWSVVEWTWEAGPPLRIALRDDGGEVLDFVMDDAGVWHLSQEPLEPKTIVPTDLTK